jgi:hypothetical protein
MLYADLSFGPGWASVVVAPSSGFAGRRSRRPLYIRVCASFGPITLIGIQGFQIIIAAVQFISFTIFNLAELHR